MDSYLIAPILRLDADVWSSISRYASLNDLVKLSLLSTVLAHRIKQGASVAKLEWTSLHYIDLSLVLGYINQFPRVSQVVFASEDSIKPHWMPANWSLLPKQLTSLSLCLSRCIGSLLHPTVNVRSLLPSLTVLELTEADEKLSSEPPWYIRLCSLPSSLLRLRLVSDRYFNLPNSDFEALPANLTELTLDCGVEPVADDFQMLATKPALPALPTSLRELHLSIASSTYHVNLGALPSSLRSFHFDSGYSMEMGEPDEYLGLSTITGSSLDLPRLQELRLPSLELSVAQALDFIPSSATLLEFVLSDVNPGNLAQAATFISKMKRLDRLGADDNTTIDSILTGKLAVPLLETLTIIGNPAPPRTGPTLKRISLSVPPSVTTLDLSLCQAASTYVNFMTYPSHLTSLTMHRMYELNSRNLSMLPSSLKKLNALLTENVLAELFKLMQQPSSRFPNLASINSFAELREAFIVAIPDQLQEFNVVLNLPKNGISPRFHKLLQSSSIQRLTVRLQRPSSLQLPAVVTLMRALPSKLVFFDLTCKYSFEIGYERFKAPAGEDTATNVSHVVFPPGLQSLDLPLWKDLIHFPEHLSRFSMRFNNDSKIEAYYTTRRPFFPSTPENATLMLPLL